LREIDLHPSLVSIEITEGLLMDNRQDVANKLFQFREVGIQISLDDFGTGYSSMSYLKKFDIDYLKIDRSFIRDMTTDAGDRAIAEAIIVMAHKLGLQVIAEGVETVEQRDLLSAANCDFAQGYLFARPMPLTEFEDFLRRSNGDH
jgi:EAL domain-containing protein (putative c-di-GMP-specific phosphodiesterase class I)